MNSPDVFPNLDSFFARYMLITYKKRQLIIRAEDTPLGAFFLKKGYVRQYLISHEGHELTTSIYKPLDIFPLNWVLNNTPSRYHFESMTDVQILRAPKQRFLELVENQPELFFKLVSRLINRLDAFSERMEYLAFGHAGQKVAAILLILAERFGQEKEKEICIKIPLTHRDIASLLGLTRETVSIEMKKLENMGIFKQKRHTVFIKNLNLLKKEAVLT